MKQIRFYLRTLIAKRSDAAGEHLTYGKLSEATGVSPTTISHLVTNQQGRIDLITLEKLCDFFGCELRDLMRLEDDP